MSFDNIPSAFLCPITQDLMQNPYVDQEGNTYEYEAILNWLKKDNTSPLTRNLLSQDQLAPNRALKDSIDEWKVTKESKKLRNVSDQMEIDTVEEVKEKKEEENDGVTRLNLEAFGDYKDEFIAIALTPVSKSNIRNPANICCVIDVSGSMGTNVTLKDENQSKQESFGLNQLDLVKHSLKTIIHCLKDIDTLSLVTFSNNANKVLLPVKMNANGKLRANLAVDAMKCDSATNLWAGLQAGLEIVVAEQNNSKDLNLNSAVFLFTDGEPNVEPPKGHIATLLNYKSKHNVLCDIHTFGYGYKLDAKLLDEIAKVGNGTFNFIADVSMVATVFCNSLSNFLCNAMQNVHLEVSIVNGNENQFKFQCGKDSADTQQPFSSLSFSAFVMTNKLEISFPIGSLQLNQSRTIVLPFSCNASTQTSQIVVLRVNCSYREPGKKEWTHQVWNDVRVTPQSEYVHIQRFRMFTIGKMNEAVEAGHLNEGSSARFIQQAFQYENDLSPESRDCPLVIGIKKDLQGQIALAVSKPDFFNRWGKSYLMSLSRAYLLQMCNNFKDFGLQVYGGTLFKELRDEFAESFNTLPAPKPSSSLYASSSSFVSPQISMRSFNNAHGGCVHGDSLISTANGTSLRASEIVPGAILETSDGNAVVKFVTKFKCSNAQIEMIRLEESNLCITPYHPVFSNKQSKWEFPINCDRVTVQTVQTKHVYNFVLQHCCDASNYASHYIANGVKVIALGHNIRDDKVASHDYFGTSKIIKDLQRLNLEQRQNGIIQYSDVVIGSDDRVSSIC
jgi:Mg-chelatase subunit ChlD